MSGGKSTLGDGGFSTTANQFLVQSIQFKYIAAQTVTCRVIDFVLLVPKRRDLLFHGILGDVDINQHHFMTKLHPYK